MHLEIAEALRRDLSVIPVRVGREGQIAPVPRKADLPEDIQELVLFQKHDVAHERYGRDMAELGDAVSAVRRRDGSRFGARGVQLAGIVAGLAVTAGVVYFGTQQLGLKIDLPWQREFREPVASRIESSVPSPSERAPAQGSRIASHTQQDEPSAALPPTPTATESISWRMASAFPKSVGGAFDAGEALSRRLAEVTSGQIRVRGYAAGEIVPAAQVLNSVASSTIEAGWTFMGLHGDKERAFKFMSGNAPLGLDANGLVRWAQSETGARARTSCSRHGASKVCRARSRGRQASG